MKYLGALSVLLLALGGCGKSPVVEGDGKESRTFSPVVVGADDTMKSDLFSLCSVLNDKDLFFRSTFLNGTSKFNFTTSQTMCGTTEVTSAVQALLSFNNGSLQYQKILGDYFISNVETRASGTISSLCQDINGLTQPLLVGNSLALRYAFTRGSDCSSNTNHRCLTVESAVKQTSDLYLVTKVDNFLIDMTAGALSGMVLKHEHWNYDMCEENKKLVNMATFTGVSN